VSRRGHPVARAAAVGAVVGGGAVVLAGAAVSGVAVHFARRVVTPDRVKVDDVRVLAVGDGTVTLDATPETTSPGRYGLWVQRGQGHVRLGEVVEKDVRAVTVTRRVEAVDAGRLEPGPARWKQ
jgi:hypothetical protein